MSELPEPSTSTVLMHVQPASYDSSGYFYLVKLQGYLRKDGPYPVFIHNGIYANGPGHWDDYAEQPGRFSIPEVFQADGWVASEPVTGMLVVGGMPTSPGNSVNSRYEYSPEAAIERWMANAPRFGFDYFENDAIVQTRLDVRGMIDLSDLPIIMPKENENEPYSYTGVRMPTSTSEAYLRRIWTRLWKDWLTEIDPAWREFVDFKEAVGEAYEHAVLRRIDPDAPWTRDNVVWVRRMTRSQYHLPACAGKVLTSEQAAQIVMMHRQGYSPEWIYRNTAAPSMKAVMHIINELPDRDLVGAAA